MKHHDYAKPDQRNKLRHVRKPDLLKLFGSFFNRVQEAGNVQVPFLERDLKNNCWLICRFFNLKKIIIKVFYPLQQPEGEK